MTCRTGIHYKQCLWLVLLIAGFTACQPVKRVLQDPVKFEQVAKEVVRRGYCINDTTITDTLTRILVRDSLVRDTLFLAAVPVTATLSIDTVFVSGTRLTINAQGKITVSCPVKEVQQIVTVDRIVRDRKKEQLLQDDIDHRNQLLNKQQLVYHQLQQRLVGQQEGLSVIQNKLRKRTVLLYGLLTLFLLYLGLRLYKNIFSNIARILPL